MKQNQMENTWVAKIYWLKTEHIKKADIDFVKSILSFIQIESIMPVAETIRLCIDRIERILLTVCWYHIATHALALLLHSSYCKN